MAHIVVAKPERGVTVINLGEENTLTIGFSLSDASYVRNNDDLVFSFSDGTTAIVKGFYGIYTPESFPDVLVAGQVTATEVFFALPNTSVSLPTEENDRLDGLDLESDRAENESNLTPVARSDEGDSETLQAQASQVTGNSQADAQQSTDSNQATAQQPTASTPATAQQTTTSNQATAPQNTGSSQAGAVEEHRNNTWGDSSLDVGVRELDPLDLGFSRNFFREYNLDGLSSNASKVESIVSLFGLDLTLNGQYETVEPEIGGRVPGGTLVDKPFLPTPAPAPAPLPKPLPEPEPVPPAPLPDPEPVPPAPVPPVPEPEPKPEPDPAPGGGGGGGTGGDAGPPNILPKFTAEAVGMVGLKESGVYGDSDPTKPDPNAALMADPAPNTQSGQVEATDEDAGTVLTYGATLAGATVTKYGETEGASFDDSVLSKTTDGAFVVLTTSFGELRVNTSTGEYTYTLTDTSTSGINRLSQGDSLRETFNLTVSDGKGGTASTPLTVDVEGTNEKPTLQLNAATLTLLESGVGRDATGIINQSGTTIFGGKTQENMEFTKPNFVSGKIISADLDTDDTSDTLLYAGVKGTHATLPNDNAFLARDPASSDATITGNFGALKLQADGTYTYTANDNNSWNEGRTETDTFTLYVKDKHGSWAETPLTVTLEGTNDKPEIGFKTGDGTHTLTDSSSESHIITGTVQGRDADAENGQGAWGNFATNKLTYGFDEALSTTLPAFTTTLPDGTVITLGTIKIDSKTGVYTFTMDKDSVAALKTGEDFAVKVPVWVRDARGALDSTEISITVKGATDIPKFGDGATATHPLKESGVYTETMPEGNTPTTETANSSAVGGKTHRESLTDSLFAKSLDKGGTDGLTFKVAELTGTGSDGKDTFGSESELPSELGEQTTVTTPYGNFVLTAAVDGFGNRGFSYTFTLADTDKVGSLVDSLGQGQQIKVGIKVNAYAEGASSDTALGGIPVTIVIDGSNDRPFFVTEAVTGNSFTLPSTVPDTGVEADPRKVVEVKDDTTDNATPVTVTGKLFAHDVDTSKQEGAESKDAASLSFSFIKREDIWKENGELKDPGGPDSQDIFSMNGDYGTISINNTGEYVYTLNNDSGATKLLGTGDSVQEVFYVKVNDWLGATSAEPVKLVITVTGKDDGFTLRGGASAITEDTTFATQNGKVEFDDPDNGALWELVNGVPVKLTAAKGGDTIRVNTIQFDSATAQDVPADGTGTANINGKYGSISVNAKGEYTYTLNPSLQNLAAATDAGKADLYWDIQRQNTDTSLQEVFKIDVASLNAKGEVNAAYPNVNGNITITLNGTNDAPILRTYSAVSTTAGEGNTGFDKNLTSFITIDDRGELYDGSAITASVRKGADLKDARVEGVIQSSDIDDADSTTASSVLTYGIRVVHVGGAGSGSSGYELVYTKADGNDYYNDGSEKLVGSGTNVEWLQSWEGTYGTLFIEANGKYSYEVNSLNGDVMALDDRNHTLTETFDPNFSISVRDAHGGMDSTKVVFTIHGNQDVGGGGGPLPAVSVADATGTVWEDGGKCDTPGGDHDSNHANAGAAKTHTGSVVAGSVPSNPWLHFALAKTESDTSGFVQSIVNEYGTMTINARSGTFTFTLHDTGVVQTLAEGTTKNIEFYVKTSGQTGEAHNVGSGSCPSVGSSTDKHVDTTKITITLTGTNDAPEITGSYNHTIAINDATDATVVTVNGTLTGTDVDAESASTTLTYALDDGTGATSAASSWWVIWSSADGGKLITTGTEPTGTLSWGKFTLNANGEYTFTLNSANTEIKVLKGGEIRSIDIPVLVLDHLNATGKGAVTITFNGSNMLPEIAAGAHFTLHEDADSTQLANMTVDFDHNFAGGATNSNISGSGVGTPVDADDTAFTFTACKGVQTALSGGAISVQGDYGILILNARTGTYTYKLDNAKAQPLGKDETVYDKFTIFAKDGQGGVSRGYLVDAKIIGKNDVPVLLVGTQMEVKESTTLVAGFDASSTDFDAGFTHTFGFRMDGGTTSVQTAYAVMANNVCKVVATKPADNEYYGTFAINSSDGKYTFTINSGAKCVKALNNQNSHTFTTTVMVDDGMGGTDTKPITVNLEGTNNAPELTLPTNGKVEFTEDGNFPATIQVTAIDYEDDESGHDPKFFFEGADNKTTASVTVSNMGTFTINQATGEIVLDKGSNNYNHLGAYNATDSTTYLSTTVKVQVADFNGATDTKDLTVLIKGVNDAPVLALAGADGLGDGINFAWKADADGTVFGKATGSDVDTNDVLSFGVQFGSGSIDYIGSSGDTDGGSAQGAYGKLSITASGEYSYTLTDAVTGTVTENETFTIWVKDKHGGAVSKDVNITFEEAGTPDAPSNSPPALTPPPALVPDLLGDDTDNLLVWSGATTCNGKGGTDMLAVGGDLFTDQDSLLALAKSPTVTNIELFLGGKAVTSLTSLGAWATANEVAFDGAGGITPDASVWTKGASTETGFDFYSSSGATDSSDDDMLLLVKQASVING